MPNKKYRYPGPQPFSDSDAPVFKGREQETKALHDLIMVERHIVLLAQSGIGKTSLLMAGVVPKLDKEYYLPLPIRLNLVAETPWQQLQQHLPKDITSNGEHLWQMLQALHEASNKVPILIFDQFEELFTLYTPKQRKSFIDNLAAVVNGKLPQQLKTELKAQLRAKTISIASARALEQVPNCKIVLAIRSDMLSFLHQLGNQIPAILRNRFELLPLLPEQARQAITLPAQATGKNYRTPRFLYTQEALDIIVEKLRERNQQKGELEQHLIQQKASIESFQLQLVCEYIETKLLAQKHFDTEPIYIKPAFFGGAAGINTIIEQFYEHSLEKINDPKQQTLAADLLEENFIKAARRISIAEVAIFADYPKLRRQSIQTLVDSRLLRREERRDKGIYYEISHDTLIAPILKRQKERKQQKRFRKLRRSLLIAVLVVVLAASLLAFAFWQNRQVSNALERAESEQAKNQKLIDAFYFYEGKFALAYKNNKFGFINKKGEAVIDYKYKKAEQFDKTGFAKVTKFAKDYLLDTLGQEYKVAYKLVDLDKDVDFLNLRANQFDSFPKEIVQHTQLKVLFADGKNDKKNNFKNIPKAIGDLKELQYLSFHHSNIINLPPELGQLSNLTTLDLTWNNLNSLPTEIGQLKNLTTLDLGGNKLNSLPTEIGQLKNLTTLDLGGNKLNSLPTEIGQLKNLTTLDLIWNKLNSLPTEIAQLKNLTTLNLTGNKLNSLPTEIAQLKKLTTLNLTGNHSLSLKNIGIVFKKHEGNIIMTNNITNITHKKDVLVIMIPRQNMLPKEIGHLINLTEFYLNGNQLSSLPKEIGQLTNLTKLSLLNNQLSNLPKELGQLTNLTLLNLSENKLKIFPTEIVQLKNLTSLDLEHNQLNSLPKEIGQLTNLTEFYLHRNQLSSLPPEIGQLKNLTTLFLYGNQLSNLPPEIGQLKNLTTLYLGRNELSRLPAEIVQLKNLTILDLGRNELSHLPAEIVQLKNLTELHLGSNQLSSLPKEIGQLNNLTELHLGSNQLSSLPKEIEKLNNLKYLTLRDNPIPKTEQEKIKKLLPNCKIKF